MSRECGPACKPEMWQFCSPECEREAAVQNAIDCDSNMDEPQTDAP